MVLHVRLECNKS